MEPKFWETTKKTVNNTYNKALPVFNVCSFIVIVLIGCGMFFGVLYGISHMNDYRVAREAESKYEEAYEQGCSEILATKLKEDPDKFIFQNDICSRIQSAARVAKWDNEKKDECK